MQLSRQGLDFYGYEAKNLVPGTVVDEIFIIMTEFPETQDYFMWSCVLLGH